MFKTMRAGWEVKDARMSCWATGTGGSCSRRPASRQRSCRHCSSAAYPDPCRLRLYGREPPPLLLQRTFILLRNAIVARLNSTPAGEGQGGMPERWRR